MPKLKMENWSFCSVPGKEETEYLRREVRFRREMVIQVGCIFLPDLFLFFFLNHRIILSIPGIGLYADRKETCLLAVLIAVICLLPSPLQKRCEGHWTELLFYFMPLELFSLIVFAQWHFYLSLFFLSLFFALEILLEIWHLGKLTEAWRGSDKETIKRKERRLRTVCGRCRMAFLSAVLLIPFVFSVFVYRMQPPVVKPDEETAEILIRSTAENGGDLLDCFCNENWKEYDSRERISLLQRLADYEAGRLGISSVPVTAGYMVLTTYGQYISEENRIEINLRDLQTLSAPSMVNTLCHEVFHAYQYNQIDGAEEKSADERIRGWISNSREYKTCRKDGYAAYASQPIEASAREYAEQETIRLLRGRNRMEEIVYSASRGWPD